MSSLEYSYYVSILQTWYLQTRSVHRPQLIGPREVRSGRNRLRGLWSLALSERLSSGNLRRKWFRRYRARLRWRYDFFDEINTACSTLTFLCFNQPDYPNCTDDINNCARKAMLTDKCASSTAHQCERSCRCGEGNKQMFISFVY